MSAQETADRYATSEPRADRPRVANVTGGSRGIGRETVSRLAADRFAVLIGYAGHRGRAEAVVEEAIAAGGRAIAVQTDVADEQQISALFATAEAEFGGVDVVVHAAGRALWAPIAELDLAELDALHRTNIRGTFVVTQQAARKIRNGGAPPTDPSPGSGEVLFALAAGVRAEFFAASGWTTC